MPRIRTLTAVGVLAGATVLGGAGLAGATDHTSEPKELELVEDGEQTQELTTFEGEEQLETETEEAPVAPDLPDAAADQAQTALDEAPAFAQDAEPEPETEGEQSLESDGDMSDDPPTEAKPDNHGQRVSEVARSDDPGPGPEHGPAVSAEAKKNGQGGAEEAEED